MSSSLRPETNKLYGLGNSLNRWKDLYVGNINSDGNISTSGILYIGSSSINVEDKLNELESNIGGGQGTVTSVNGLSPDQNGLITINSTHISSSFSPSNFSTGSELGLNRYISGIDNKLQYVTNNILYTTGSQTISGDKIFSGSLYGAYTIPSNNNSKLLTTTEWVNNKFGSLTGALIYRGTTTYNSNDIKSSSSGDVWAISDSGILSGSDFVSPGNLVIFKENLSGSILSGSYNIIDITSGIRSINGIFSPATILYTGDISEGTGSNPSNPNSLWYTDSRSRAAISSSSPYIVYNSSTGIISSSLLPFTKLDVASMITGSQHSGISFTYANNVLTASVTSQGSVTSVNSITPTNGNGNIVLNTDYISESNSPNNKYFTESRARAAFSAGTGISITNGAISSTITQYTDTDAVSASRNSIITGSLSGVEENKAPTVKATKDYIASQITTSMGGWTSSSITVSPSNEFITYTPNASGNGTAIISSSITSASLQSISRNSISSGDSLLTYTSNTGIISSSIKQFVNDNFISSSLKAAANGVASLGSDGKVPSSQLPALQITNVSSGLDANKPSPASQGDFFIATDVNKSYVYDGSSWIQIVAGTNVSSVNGLTGPAVTLTTTNINEGNNLYYTDTRAKAAISAAANNYIVSYNNGIISSSITENSIKDLTVNMLSGSDQTRHSGIRFTYANGVISASVTSQGSVTSVNNITPTNGNITLSTNHLSSSTTINSYNVPANTNTSSPIETIINDYILSKEMTNLGFTNLDRHLVYFHKNGAYLDKPNIFTNDNQFSATTGTSFTGNISHNNATSQNNTQALFTTNLVVSASSAAGTTTGLIDASLARSVTVPTLSTVDDTKTLNAVNKSYLVDYFANKTSSGNILTKDGSNWTGLTNVPTMRTNLGLGSSATVNTGSTNGTIPVLTANGLPAIGGVDLTTLPSISKHSDTYISSPADKQVLTYDSGTSKWINKTPSGGSFIKFATVVDATNDFASENIVVLKIDSNAANPVLNLPATSTTNNGKMYIIKKVGVTPHNDLSITGPLLEGNFSLPGNYSSLTVIADNSQSKWMIV